MKVTWMITCHWMVCSEMCSALMKGFQQVDGGDADQRHRELDLHRGRIHMREPLRLVGVFAQVEARYEGFVAADGNHDQQVRDHHHVDQPQHNQHDLGFANLLGVMHQMHQLDTEEVDVDRLRHNQAQIERGLQPAAPEDDLGKAGQGNIAVSFLGIGFTHLADYSCGFWRRPS
jgi:hypothetical protein